MDVPDPAADRRALRAVAVQFFVNGALFASIAPRLPEVRDRIGVSVAGIGTLISLAGVAGFLGSIAVGRSITRFGSRTVLVVGGAMMALALPVVGFATTAGVLLIGLMVISFFDVLVDASMNLQGSWLSRRRHTPVINRLHGLWSLGTLLGGLIASRLAAADVGLGAHLTGAAIVLAGALAFASRGLLRVDAPPAPSPAGTDGSAARRGRALGLVMFAAAGAAAIAIEQTSLDWSTFRMVDDFGVEPGPAGLAFVMFTAGMTAGRLGGDRAVSLLGRQRLLLVASTATGAGLVVATLVPWRWAPLIGFASVGLGVATMLPALYDAAAHHPGRSGDGLGALTAGMRVAVLGLPIVVGSLAATRLDVGSAIAIVALPATVAFFVLARRLERTAADSPPAELAR